MLSAFDYLKHLVVQTRDNKEENLRHKPFAFDEECVNQPSEIELIYHLDNARFLYSIKWNRNEILFETLEELKAKTSTVLYNRWNDIEHDVVKVFFSPKMNVSDDENYIIRTSVLKNNSVLSTITKTNISHPLLKSHLQFFMTGFETVELFDIDLNEELPDEKTEHNQKIKKIICLFLQSVDTNIKSYEKLKVDVELPAELLQKIKVLAELDGEDYRSILRLDEDRHTINTFHRLGNNAKSGRERLPLSEQSDGTKEILRLLMVLNDAIKNKKTIILDDYSSGIQRNTLNKLLKFFIGASENSQLIISTQDYSLLDFDIVRRDSIRFMIKNEDAETSVKSIDLSKLHKNSSLHHYVSKMNIYKQIPVMDESMFEKLLLLYKAL